MIEHVSVREGYDRWASTYDTEGNPLVALNDAVVAALMGDLVGCDALDLGCGTGHQSELLSAAGARVTALDFSAGMLAQARARLPDVRFVVSDLREQLPFDDGSFDRVVSCLVMEHLVDLQAFMGEARRVCRLHGALVLTDMHPALRLRGNQAHFKDGDVEVRPESIPHDVSDYVKAALAVGLRIDVFEEPRYPDDLAMRIPRAAKFVGWPMLVAMRLSPAGCGER